MANSMTDVYVALIRAGKRTLETVPEALRAEVKKALNTEKTHD